MGEAAAIGVPERSFCVPCRAITVVKGVNLEPSGPRRRSVPKPPIEIRRPAACGNPRPKASISSVFSTVTVALTVTVAVTYRKRRYAKRRC